LTKSYFYRDETDFSGGFIYDRAEGCKINWNDGKDATTKVEIKKQRNKNTKQTREVKKSVPTDSFFNFFNPPIPHDHQPEDHEHNDAEESDLEEKLQLDYQLGEDIKEKIIPHAVYYFTGEAPLHELDYPLDEDDEDGQFDEFDDDDDDEDEQEDDDESDDDDVDGSKPKSEAAECKQS